MNKPLLFLIFLLAAIAPCITKAQESQTVTAGEFTKPIEFPGGNCVYRWTNSNTFIGLNAAGGVGNIAPFKTGNPLPIPAVATFTAEPIASDFAYVPVSSTKSISVISIATHSVVASIPVGDTPFGVAVNPQGTLVYVSKADSRTISVISTATNKIVAGIFVGLGPRGILVSADGTRIYVANSDADTISIIDAATNEVIAEIPTGMTPISVVISPDGSKLYTVNSNGRSVSVISLANNSLIATIPVGDFPSCAVFGQDGKTLYVTNSGESTVSLINTVTNAVARTIEVGEGPMAIAVTPDNSKAYVTVRSGSAAVINFADNTVTTRSLSPHPGGLSVGADGSVYIIDTQNGVLDHYSASLSIIGQVAVGASGLSLGNFIKNSQPCTAAPVKFTITVNAASVAAINNGPVTGDISACIGTASASPNIQRFKVSGTGLTDNITATAPTGFELSLTPSGGYANAVTLVQSGGRVTDVSIYVRASAGANRGYISGEVTLRSGGAPEKYASVMGRVTDAPGVNNPGDKVAANGEVLPAISVTGTANIYRWTNDNPAIGLPASGEGDIASFTAINNGNIPVVANIKITPVSKQLAYIANLDDNSVSVVDIDAKAILKTIPVGENPTAIAVTRDGKLVFASNNGSNTVSVINTSSNTVIKTIPVGDYPSALALSADGSKLYVANNAINKVAIISTSTFQILDIINVAGQEPNGLVVDHAGKRLYVLNTNSSISVVDLATNSVLTNIVINGGILSLCISPDDSRLYVSRAIFGDIDIFNTSTYASESTFPASGPIRRLGISPDGNTLYADGTFIYDVPTATRTNSVNVGASVSGLTVSADGQQLFFTNDFESNLVVVNAALNTVVSKIPVGKSPFIIGSFIKEASGCSGVPVEFKITVNPTPATTTITAGPAMGTISACVGTESAFPNVQQVKVSGVNLTAGITATAPAGFEISLSKVGGYGANVTMPQIGGKVDNAVVYVRASANGAAGSIVGNVTLRTTGGDDVLVRVSAFINALPTVSKPDEQSVDNGATITAVNFAGTGNSYTWTNDNPSIGLSGSGAGDIPAFTAVNTGSTPAVATITVTPQLKSYIYVANSSDNTVSVINPEGGAIIKTIPVGTLPYGITVSPNGTRVYVSNISDGSVSVINAASNAVIATVPVGNRPFGMSVSSDGSRVYVANEASNTVSVIDGVSNTVVATIPTGQFPVTTLVSPDGSRLYVANQNSSSVSVFNTSNNTLVTEIPTVGQAPAQMAFSSGGGVLYVVGIGNQNTFQAFDTATFALIKSLSFSKDAHAIAVTPDGSKIYVTDNTENKVWVLDGTQLAYTGSIPVGANPNGVSVSSDGNFVFVVNGRTGVAGGSLSVIGTAIDQVLYTLPVGNGPISIGNFVGPTTSCPGEAVSFTITVAPPPPPVLSLLATLAPLTTVYGTPSASQSFAVLGSNVFADVKLTAPAGFEVSTDNARFGNTATISNGTVFATLFIRLKATSPVGTYSGNVLATTPNANDATLAMPNSTVTPAMLTVTADNKTKLLGADNPILTVTYSGFVNNENESVLNRRPDVSTTATTTSEAGDYPITAGNALAQNYNFRYVPGVLTIQRSLAMVTIPNTFTPNDDGVNDTWNLTFLQGYNKATVNIFDRWGGPIYSSVGYARAWDGKRNGAVLPAGTYYYIINPKDGQKPRAGWVTIVR